MSDRSRRRRPRRAHRMARKRRDVPLRVAIFSLLSGLIAIVGVLLVYKYKGEGPAEEVPRAKTVVTDTTSVVASDSSFSGALELRIYDALSELGIWADLIQIRSGAVDTVAAPREIRVRVPSDLALVLCNLEISRLVERLGGRVFEAIEYPGPREVVMKVGEEGRITHRILLRRQTALVRRAGRIALVLDDFGYRSRRLTEQFCTISQPLTLAVFPHSDNSQAIVTLALRNGHEVMVHLPMEPHDGGEDPGPGAILVAHPTGKIREITRNAIRAVPRAAGVNNHMGSKATEDPRVMRTVLTEVRRAGLFFLDSRTSSRSIAYRMAGEMGISCSKTTMFIDNEYESDAIEQRLFELAERATKDGYAVGIGHDRRSTLHALQRVLPRLEKRGFEFVKVSEIME